MRSASQALGPPDACVGTGDTCAGSFGSKEDEITEKLYKTKMGVAKDQDLKNSWVFFSRNKVLNDPMDPPSQNPHLDWCRGGGVA